MRNSEAIRNLKFKILYGRYMLKHVMTKEVSIVTTRYVKKNYSGFFYKLIRVAKELNF